jgi:hypothetical protein
MIVKLKIIGMKKLLIAFLACTLLPAFYSCAPVKFYSNSALTEKTGLKYYSVKPYLLVEKESETEKITRSTVLYLPDLANPNFMVVNGGPGAKRAEMKLADGYVTSFGLTTDAGLSESVTSLAKLITEGSGAFADLNTLKAITATNNATFVMELYELIIGPEGTSVKKIEIK